MYATMIGGRGYLIKCKGLLIRSHTVIVGQNGKKFISKRTKFSLKNGNDS